MIRNTFTYIRIILIAGALYLLFITLFSRTAADVDLWGYLSFGRIFWKQETFPFQDIFSYVPTNPVWVYHEWLTGVIFYSILDYAGPAGLQVLRYIIIVITLYLIYLTAIKKSGNSISAWMALLPAVVLISYGYSTIVRAQIFTYLFFILTIFIIESARRDQKWLVLLWLVPIQLLWCNLHGGYLTGLGLIGLYALGDAVSGKKIIPLVIILLPATLITLINPYGIEYWKFIFHAVSMPRPEIDEWMSITAALKNSYMIVPVVSFILLSLVCFFSFMTRSKKYFTEILILMVICYLGYKHARHTIFLGILFGAFFPAILFDIRKTSFPKQRFVNMSWIAPILLVIFFLSSHWLIHRSSPINYLPSYALTVSYSYYPIGALNWMKNNKIRGYILPFFGWGEFLMWSCYPDCKVAMDGRYETVYPEAVHKEYFNFFMAREGWQIFLNKYPHDMVLIKPHTKIHDLMLQQSAWKHVYADSTSSLFMRKTFQETSTNIH